VAAIWREVGIAPAAAIVLAEIDQEAPIARPWAACQLPARGLPAALAPGAANGPTPAILPEIDPAAMVARRRVNSIDSWICQAVEVARGPVAGRPVGLARRLPAPWREARPRNSYAIDRRAGIPLKVAGQVAGRVRVSRAQVTSPAAIGRRHCRRDLAVETDLVPAIGPERVVVANKTVLAMAIDLAGQGTEIDPAPGAAASKIVLVMATVLDVRETAIARADPAMAIDPALTAAANRIVPVMATVLAARETAIDPVGRATVTVPDVPAMATDPADLAIVRTDPVRAVAASNGLATIIAPIALGVLVTMAGPTIGRGESTTGTSGTIRVTLTGPTSTTIGITTGPTIGTIATIGLTTAGGTIIRIPAGAGRTTPTGGRGRRGRR
jgi:hypothetical protein